MGSGIILVTSESCYFIGHNLHHSYCLLNAYYRSDTILNAFNSYNSCIFNFHSLFHLIHRKFRWENWSSEGLRNALRSHSYRVIMIWSWLTPNLLGLTTRQHWMLQPSSYWNHGTTSNGEETRDLLLLHKFFHHCLHPVKSEAHWTSQMEDDRNHSEPWRIKCHVKKTFGEMHQLRISHIPAWDCRGEFQGTLDIWNRRRAELKPCMPFKFGGRNQWTENISGNLKSKPLEVKSPVIKLCFLPSRHTRGTL